MSEVKGSVLVVGGGIAGMQASLDLANSGFSVYLLERGPSIGGPWPSWTRPPHQRLFHVNHLTQLVEVGRHLNIEILTLSEVFFSQRRSGPIFW